MHYVHTTADGLEGLGGLAAESGDAARAAWLFGAATAHRAAMGMPRWAHQQPWFERDLALAQPADRRPGVGGGLGGWQRHHAGCGGGRGAAHWLTYHLFRLDATAQRRIADSRLTIEPPMLPVLSFCRTRRYSRPAYSPVSSYIAGSGRRSRPAARCGPATAAARARRRARAAYRCRSSAVPAFEERLSRAIGVCKLLLGSVIAR